MTTHNVYGVFLQPDPATAVAISSITFQVQRQFGFVSAGAFPPHATLAGSVPITHEPDRVIEALDPLLSQTTRFPVVNSGVTKLTSAIVFDVDELDDGSTNLTLHALANAVNGVLSPMTVPLDRYLYNEFDETKYRAHFSLASHELSLRPDLSAEVESFIQAMPFEGTPRFEAETVVLYQFWSDDWSGEWWRSLRWEHCKSWHLK